ncbi:hypothetical protein AKJ16_DCAP12316 [Drosera capensis]
MESGYAVFVLVMVAEFLFFGGSVVEFMLGCVFDAKMSSICCVFRCLVEFELLVRYVMCNFYPGVSMMKDCRYDLHKWTWSILWKPHVPFKMKCDVTFGPGYCSSSLDIYKDN